MKLLVSDICDIIINKDYKIILISGNGGSEKSTLANLLKNECQKLGKAVCIISTDDFLLDKNYRKSTLISYINKNGQVKNGYMASTFPEAYDFEKLKNTITEKREDLIIIEGIGAAKEDLREHIENKVEEIQKKVEDRIGTIRDENGIPTVFGEELKMFPKLREYYIKAKKTPLYDKFRHSGLNPYHFGVRTIKADTLDEAKRIIREDAKKAAALRKKVKAQFIWNGTRYYSDRYCPPQQEFEEDGVVLRAGVNVADRSPRNKEGKLDLLAEEPILISIIPVEGPALIGHACMQYKDQVLNRLLPSIHTDPLYQKYKEYSEYFYIYPSQLGINPDKLYEAIKEHNIEHMDDKYNPLTRNCAQNVARVLKKVGVKDFDFYGPDWLGLGYATPGNNPFGKGILPWCRKHGVRVHLDEVAAYDKRYPMTNAENKKRRKNMRQIKKSREDIIER